MCNWCEPNGWKRRTCNICGDEHPAKVSISLATDDPDSEFPYTTMDLCLECERGGALEMAVAKNREKREILGLTPLDL